MGKQGWPGVHGACGGAGAAEEVVVGGGVGPCPQSPGREYALKIVRRRRPRVLSGYQQEKLEKYKKIMSYYISYP